MSLERIKRWGHLAVVIASFVMVGSLGNAATKKSASQELVIEIKAPLEGSKVSMEQLEEGLETDMKDMDDAFKTYTESGCKKDPSNEACVDLRAQMRTSFKSMLTTMDEKLPDVEASLAAVSAPLKKGLIKMGRSKTSAQRSKDFKKAAMAKINKGKKTAGNEAPPKRGRLSQSMQKLLNIVSMNKSSELDFLAKATTLYSDVAEAEMLMGIIKDQIAATQANMFIDETLGEISEADISLVSGVKGVIFGEDTSAYDEALPAPDSREMDRVSQQEVLEAPEFDLEL